MSAIAQPVSSQPKQGSPLLYFLALVSVIFIAILIFAYVVTKQTRPVFLDEHGKPVTSAPARQHGPGR